MRATSKPMITTQRTDIIPRSWKTSRLIVVVGDVCVVVDVGVMS